MLAAQISAPGTGRYDPTVHPDAARRRFQQIRQVMIDQRHSSTSLQYPPKMLSIEEAKQHGAALRPTGPAAFLVQHALDELARLPQFAGVQPASGGYRIVTTVDPALQRALEHQADERTAGSVMLGQPPNLQAAAAAVQPGTGRVLAYYGGRNGAGIDYAGARTDPQGGGQGHPPGGSFTPYVLAAALHAGISVQSRWASPPSKSFPAFPSPVKDSARCVTGASVCTLTGAATAGLRIPLLALADRIGPDKVIDAARAAGIETIWETHDSRPIPLDRRDPARLAVPTVTV